MDRRTFVLGTAAAAVYAARPFAWQAAAVELGSIDGSVSGNQFTADAVSRLPRSIKLTWAMVSLPAGDARATTPRFDRCASTPIGSASSCNSRTDRVCPSSQFVQRASSARSTSRWPARSTRRRSSARPACAASSAAIPNARRSRCTSTTWSRRSAAVRSRIVDSGVKLAVENHGGDLQAREMKMMIEAVGPDVMGVCLDSGNPDVDARGSAHDARDADSATPRRATSATAPCGWCRRASPCAG